VVNASNATRAARVATVKAPINAQHAMKELSLLMSLGESPVYAILVTSPPKLTHFSAVNVIHYARPVPPTLRTLAMDVLNLLLSSLKISVARLETPVLVMMATPLHHKIHSLVENAILHARHALELPIALVPHAQLDSVYQLANALNVILHASLVMVRQQITVCLVQIMLTSLMSLEVINVNKIQDTSLLRRIQSFTNHAMVTVRNAMVRPWVIVPPAK